MSKQALIFLESNAEANNSCLRIVRRPERYVCFKDPKRSHVITFKPFSPELPFPEPAPVRIDTSCPLLASSFDRFKIAISPPPMLSRGFNSYICSIFKVPSSPMELLSQLRALRPFPVNQV